MGWIYSGSNQTSGQRKHNFIRDSFNSIESSKKSQLTEFHPCAPSMKYLQDDTNTCCFGSLYSVMYASGFFPENTITEHIQ